jgi:SAM-dependent methyltransferase
VKNGHGSLLDAAERYYTARLLEHGVTHWGVDWNSTEGQETRYRQLLRVVREGDDGFSINDYGCGYGGLYGFMTRQGTRFHYQGFDISAAMIESATANTGEASNVRFHVGHQPKHIADYSVASGIFHVKQDTTATIWHDYMLTTLDDMYNHSRKGFAFNCLTTYSDNVKMRGHLFYANPNEIFDLCMRKYARNVALLHDYGLYEFTVIVRL